MCAELSCFTLPANPNRHAVIAGDFNFTHDEHDRQFVNTGVTREREMGMAEAWDILFILFLEIVQDFPTRFPSLATGREQTAARLDRIYINVPG